MKFFDELTHKILSDKKLLLYVFLIFLLVYPLKQLSINRICNSNDNDEFVFQKKDDPDWIIQKYFEALCD